MNSSVTLSIVMLVIAYLSGSICSAVIVTRIFNLPDPCTEGSKNPGATNVLRLAGKKYAAMVMLFDVLKGFIPVYIAKHIGVNEYVVAYMCFTAVLGHMFPIFFSFKGGKGVATALGAIIALQFMLGFLVTATWLTVLRITRYSSMASMIAMLAMPIFSLYTIGNLLFITPLFLITLFVFYKHRENINRLLDGTETKVNFKRLQSNKKSE